MNEEYGANPSAVTNEVIIKRSVEKHFRRKTDEYKAKQSIKMMKGILYHDQKQRCFYCKKFYTHPARFTVDHKIPRALGGTNDISNLCLACVECNNLKGSMTESEFLSSKAVVVL